MIFNFDLYVPLEFAVVSKSQKIKPCLPDAIASVRNVTNAPGSTKLLAQTQIRNILGTRSLSEILREKEAIAQETLAILDLATDPWGELSGIKSGNFREIELFR